MDATTYITLDIMNQRKNGIMTIMNFRMSQYRSFVHLEELKLKLLK